MNGNPAEWKTAVERVQRYARALLKDDSVGRLVRSVGDCGELFLFGGAPRDVAFAGARAVGDIDIFVEGQLDVDAVASVSRETRRTNFGGYRLIVGRHDIDIWELASSYAFRFEKKSDVGVQQLLKTVCFSTDGVAISLATRKVTVSEEFVESFSKRVIDFVRVPSDPNILVAVRAARLITKLDLRPSRRLSTFLEAEIDRYGSAAFISAEERWRGRRVLDDLTFAKLRKMFDSQAIS